MGVLQQYEIAISYCCRREEFVGRSEPMAPPDRLASAIGAPAREREGRPRGCAPAALLSNDGSSTAVRNSNFVLL